MKLRSIAKAALTLALGVMASVATAARTDVNTPNYAEDFEANPEGLWANGVPSMAVTNGWYAGAADQSYVTNMTYTFTGISHSISSAAHTRVLKLNTEGATLTNDLDSASFASQKLYVDTMVQFVVSDDLPTSISNTAVKTAVFLKNDGATTNLYVYHGTKPGVQFGAPEFTAVTNLVASNWYRLTIALDAVNNDGDQAEAMQVKINGSAVSSATKAYGDNWKSVVFSGTPGANGGTWFLSALRRPGGTGYATADQILDLGFQGTGFIDDLVVTDEDPFDTAPAAVYWTITQNVVGSGAASPAGNITILDGTSTSVVYTAADWYRISALTNGVTEVSDATGDPSYVLAIGPVTADTSVTAVFAQPATLGGVNTAWQSQFGTEAEVAAGDADGIDLATEYLLDTDPTVDDTVTFKIDSIVAAGGDVDVTVSLAVAPAPVAPAGPSINGTLNLYGRDSLTTGTWGSPIGTQSINLNGTATFSFTGVGDANKFYKAVIE